MKKSKDDLVCEECNKVCEALVTRDGFIMSYYIEWVCEECFAKLEGVEFDKYGEEK